MMVIMASNLEDFKEGLDTFMVQKGTNSYPRI